MRFFAVAASLALSAAGLSFCAGTASAAMDPFANLKFRSIGPAAPGGRVTAVAGVAAETWLQSKGSKMALIGCCHKPVPRANV